MTYARIRPFYAGYWLIGKHTLLEVTSYSRSGESAYVRFAEDNDDRKLIPVQCLSFEVIRPCCLRGH